MSDKICKCGNPNCKCGETQAATQPSDKFLPKEDKGNIKDGTINLPVNPAAMPEKGINEYKPDRAKGPYQASEVPVDGTFWGAKKAKNGGIDPVSLENEEFYAMALQRIHSVLAENISNLASDPTNLRFFSRPCSWRIGKDGLREVAFNWVSETKHPFAAQNTFSGEMKEYVAYATLDNKMVVSKHMDDKSAMLACQLYNKYLDLK